MKMYYHNIIIYYLVRTIMYYGVAPKICSNNQIFF